MNWMHVHLIVNHVPVIGAVVGVAIFILAALAKSEPVKRAMLGLLFVLAVVALVVYFTGTRAEDPAEKLSGVSEKLVDAHQEAALLALIVVGVLGLVALVALARSRGGGGVEGWASAAVVVIGLAACVLLARTAELGGRIRHPEIRPGGVEAPAGAEQRGAATIEGQRSDPTGAPAGNEAGAGGR